MKPIVTVGLDSRAESLATARWAAREAQSRGAGLRILHARAGRPDGPDRPANGGGQDGLPRWIMERARIVVDERCPGLPVTEELTEGDPVASLLEAAGDSQVVVLGSRDMAPLASYYLGDIGLHVVARADAPVVLVRAREATGPVAEDGAVVLGLSLHGPCEELCEFAFATAARRGVMLRAVHGEAFGARVHPERSRFAGLRANDRARPVGARRGAAALAGEVPAGPHDRPGTHGEPGPRRRTGCHRRGAARRGAPQEGPRCRRPSATSCPRPCTTRRARWQSSRTAEANPTGQAPLNRHHRAPAVQQAPSRN